MFRDADAGLLAKPGHLAAAPSAPPFHNPINAAPPLAVLRLTLPYRPSAAAGNHLYFICNSLARALPLVLETASYLNQAYNVERHQVAAKR
ncbi:MAG: hypothetical protein V4754_04205 [Pseudomonadota bacterium]